MFSTYDRSATDSVPRARGVIQLVYSADPGATWDSFVQRTGVEIVRSAYRLRERFPRRNEEVWDILVDDCLAGWGSLIPDALDGYPLLGVGIFPEYQRRGVRQIAKSELADIAQREGYPGVKTTVRLSNPIHLARVLRESATSKFRFAGFITLPPPGYAQFVYSFKE